MLDTTTPGHAALFGCTAHIGAALAGVTSDEFHEITRRHLHAGRTNVPRNSTEAFLVRCCALGLLRLEVTDMRRFVPTEDLALLLDQMEAD